MVTVIGRSHVRSTALLTSSMPLEQIMKKTMAKMSELLRLTESKMSFAASFSRRGSFLAEPISCQAQVSYLPKKVQSEI